ncbi:hypothetical protein ACEPAH_805 [Sanghuangporus vaninii]
MPAGSFQRASQPIATGSSFTPSSWSSSLGVSEALASYRRSQYIITAQNVAASVDTDSRPGPLDEEEVIDEEEETPPSADEEELLTPVPQDEGELEWDNVLESAESHTPVQTTIPTSGPRHDGLTLPPGVGRLPSQIHLEPLPHTGATQRTPLLRKSTSRLSIRVQHLQAPGIDDTEFNASQGSASYTLLAPPDAVRDKKTRPTRKPSSASARSEKIIPAGRSTFGQTLFNSIAILLGFGMLAEPLAFALSGWIAGSVLILFYGIITCHTAKILARIMADDPQLRTYADIGNKAFGPHSRFLVSSLFCLELFTVGVVLVTLFADSLHSVMPTYSSEAYKLMGLVVLVPSVFFPLSVLSYTSILGILSTLLITAVLFIDGLSKRHGPGSLWDPATTSLSIASWGKLGVAFGLFMAGFSGHAVLSSLARDMQNPKDFDKMINLAFIAATIIYALIGGCGYLMFGDSVSDEVSKDLLATPGYNAFINKLAVWSLVVMPLTKFGLSTRPVVITLEIMLGLEPNSQPQMHVSEVPGGTSTQAKQSKYTKGLLIFLERTAFTCLAVAVSIFFPEFSSVMAFVGAFWAFLLCVIGPVSAKIVLERKCGWKDGALLLIAIVMTLWGTIAAFIA